MCSVHVSNELGVNHPKTAKFPTITAMVSSTLFGIFFIVAIIAMRRYYPKIFSYKPKVIKKDIPLGLFLGSNHFLNSIQHVLHGK